MVNTRLLQEEILNGIERLFFRAEDVIDELRAEARRALDSYFSSRSFDLRNCNVDGILSVVQPVISKCLGRSAEFATDLRIIISDALNSNKNATVPKPESGDPAARRRLDRMMDPNARAIARGMGFR